jgi:ATP-dependent RNA helicase DeaD
MNFEDFSLSKETMKSISEMGFEEPTPIQVSAIPLILSNCDIVGQAQTGTGKTAAFGIPIAERCQKGRRKPFTIVLEPTRELAVQVAQEIHKIGKYKKISVLPVYGGTPIDRQIMTLQQGVNVVVGTPGRVIDLLNRKTLSLSEIKIVVLDEADEMLDMGFIEDIETILKATPAERQTLLFSATIPQPIMNIARRYMRSPEKIQVNIDVVIPKIRQIFYEVREENKINALSRILDVEKPQLAIVFCHTKRKVDEVSMKLSELGYNAGAIHGDYTQARRDDVMNKFKGGMLDILVATDVAARGLDIKNVTHVINYGIPQHPDSYVHRIGRTGRAGKSGIAITLVTPREYKHLRLIEKNARTIIDRKQLPSSADVVRAREKNIVRDIFEIIRGNRHAGYLKTVKELSDNYGFGDIAAAALCAAYGEIKEKPVEENYKNNENVHLFKTVGRKDNIKTADAKSIASKAYIPFNKIRKNRYRVDNNIVNNS